MKLYYQIITFFTVVGLLCCSEFMFSYDITEHTGQSVEESGWYQNKTNISRAALATQSEHAQGHAVNYEQEEAEIHHHHEVGDDATEGIALSEVSDDEDLYDAIKHDHIAIVESYLDRGVRVDTQNPKTGQSLLHVAVESNAVDVTLLLLNRGAKINVIDAQDDTPLDYAMRDNNQDMIQLLQSHNAKSSHHQSASFGFSFRDSQSLYL
ncbi:MAG: ankyrin repeat domain-containing protein [Candidatus Chromulinivorax sp.]|nr:ankyrin repeat domain-containing protein [Candidatus Chromulinivorax sp.]